jgi:hypothetical protein
MTKDEMRELMERAVEWPEEAQVELVQSMEDIEARYYGVYITSKDERAALKRSQDDVKHGRFALHDDVKMFFIGFIVHESPIHGHRPRRDRGHPFIHR